MAELEAQSRSDREKIQWIQEAQNHLRDVFAALASKSLHESGKEFAGRINQQLNAHLGYLKNLQTGQGQQLTTHSNSVHHALKSHQDNLVKLNGALQTNLGQQLTNLGQQLTTHSGSIHLVLDSHLNGLDKLNGALQKGLGQQLTSHSGQINVIKTTLEKSIDKIDHHIRDLEGKREGAYQSLRDQVVNLEKAYKELHKTTEQLASALNSGPTRGTWGEISLRRIVELAGLLEHVHFASQEMDEGPGRPDMTIRMPSEGRIPVDSKFIAKAYFDAMASTDDSYRSMMLEEHAKALRQYIKDLSAKAYWEQMVPSPELVIMFVPVESCLMAAYEVDPEIIDYALQHKVILASPITLLGFMKSIAYGWQQFEINKNSRRILEEANELFRRTVKWLDFLCTTGEKLEGATEAYNRAVASLVSRFIPKVNEIQKLAMNKEKIPEPKPVETGIRLPPRTRDMEDPPGLFDDGSSG